MHFTYINSAETERIKKQLIENGDKLSYKEIINLCNRAFPKIPISVYQFENNDFEFQQRNTGGMNVIYRAREIKNKENTPFTRVSEISYIPEDKKQLITDFGRANKPEQSMFYGAFEYTTACSECIVNSEELMKKGSSFFTVGIWKIIDKLTLAEIPHSEKLFTEFYNTVNFDSESIKIEHIKEKNFHIRKQINSDYDYDNLMFFTDQFARFDDQNSYKISNYYCDRVFNRIENLKVPFEIEGIIYPSILNSYQHDNIVLKPVTVDKKLKFVGAMLVWFIPAQNGKSGAQFIPVRQHITANEDGFLEWNF